MLKKVFKYVIMALVVAMSTKYIPATPPTNKEIITISAIAAILFAFLDIYTPSISSE